MKVPRGLAGWAIALAGFTVIALGVALTPSEAPESATYSTYDAHPGGYQAWYELLEREGLDVGRFERPSAFLDHSVERLIVSVPPVVGSDDGPTNVDRAALDAWVGGGGTLVVLGPTALSASSPLGRVAFTGLRDGDLRAWGVQHLSIGRHVLVWRGRYQRGTIYRLRNETLLSNAQIGRADNARLAFGLARPLHGGSVAFDETIHGYRIPEHWWLIAPRRLVIAISLAAVVVVIALLGATMRLGPPLLVPARRESTSSEYVEAVSSLYAGAQAVGQGLSDTLHATKRMVATAHALPDDLPTRDLAMHIQRADLRGALAELDVLASTPAPRPRHLLRGTRLAHLLRKELDTHGSSR